MASAGTVTIELDANTVKLLREMLKAQRQTKKSTSSMAADAKKAFNSMKKNAISTTKALTGIGLAAAASATAIVRATSSAANELQVLSRTANTSVGDFQRMAFAANQFGIGNEKLSDILKDVTDRVGDFIQTGGGPMADFFEKIAPKVGVTADQFARLSGRDALQLYVSSLEKANLSQADMVFYLEAMASDSVRLLPLLRDNGKVAGEFADQADRLGIVLSEIDISAIEQARIEMAKAQEVGRIYANQFTVGISTSLGALAKMFTQSREGAASIADQVDTISTAVIIGAINMGGEVAKLMTPLKSVVNTIWNAYKSLPTWAQELGVLGSFLFGRSGFAVVTAVALVNDSIKAITDSMSGFDSIEEEAFGDKFTKAKIELQAINEELVARNELANQPVGKQLASGFGLAFFDSIKGQVSGTTEELEERGKKLVESIRWMMENTYQELANNRPSPNEDTSLFDALIPNSEEIDAQTQGLINTFLQMQQDIKNALANASSEPASDAVEVPTISPFGNVEKVKEQLAAIAESTKTQAEKIKADIALVKQAIDAGLTQPFIDAGTTAEAVLAKLNQDLLDVREPLTEMDEFTKKAAQGMQSAFADFLFNPFEEGIKGMLKSFTLMLARMAAEAMAAKILGQLFGGLAGSENEIASSIGKAFGGTVPGVRDVGGRGEAGKPYVINPKAGPEIFIPTTAGEFIPNIDEMGGGTNLSLTIDARDAGAEARIKDMIIREMVPQIISAAKQDTIKTLRRPRFA